MTTLTLSLLSIFGIIEWAFVFYFAHLKYYKHFKIGPANLPAFEFLGHSQFHAYLRERRSFFWKCALTQGARAARATTQAEFDYHYVPKNI